MMRMYGFVGAASPSTRSAAAGGEASKRTVARVGAVGFGSGGIAAAVVEGGGAVSARSEQDWTDGSPRG